MQGHQQQQQNKQENHSLSQLQWSHQFKSDGINIDGNIIKKTKYNDYGDCILLEPAFTAEENHKRSCKFKIIKQSGLIVIGICMKSKMEEIKYDYKNIPFRDTGHGFYMIVGNGLSLSHSQKQWNGARSCFGIESGCVIFCEYDPSESKLIFRKDDKFYFELTINKVNPSDPYVMFVGINCENEQVELISPVN